ncbi:MAG: response regulator [Chloroflexota bacterium]|jgi:DNA-binding response OmpR family regulator|nr:response regulator [Aggregatilineaceae bacterium]
MTKRVLILDDNADNRRLLVFALHARPYEICEAALGQDVIAMLDARTAPFDLALLDVELPDGDGLALVSRLREHSPEIVLIMLSANDGVDLVQQACDLGANAYVVKPFNLPKLLEFIQAFEDETIRADTALQRF